MNGVPSRGVQATLDDLGTPLVGVTFVVVDLETTGGSASASAITEVGAVKVRGGEVLGEFQTLVRPTESIPVFIQVLTGITDSMVASAPRIESVLSRNHRLSSLAVVFGATTVPDHRALHDARATVDVLHGLLERVGNLGVHTLEELASYTSRVTPAQRRKRFLAEQLPPLPGVYVFQDERGRPLYVGTSRNIRARARTYFTASEQRTRMAEMVALASSIRPIVCQTILEAQVRELRLIAAHKPRYNRRSTRPERVIWVKLTQELFPRLSIVREVRPDGARYLGPFRSRRAAEAAVAAVHEVVPLRQCRQRLTTRATGTECVLGEIGRCGGPCSGRQSVEEYASVVGDAVGLLTGDARPVTDALLARMSALAEQQRFEDAGTVRDRLLHLVRAAARTQRLAPLASSPQIVAARRAEPGGWELVCVRYGRLAGTSVSPPGADPMPYVRTLCATAEVVEAPTLPAPAASAEETEIILRWLEAPGVRIVELDGSWSCPVGGAGGLRTLLDDGRPADVAPFDRDLAVAG
jgi:DNA polymerase-3 subunit epsilon